MRCPVANQRAFIWLQACQVHELDWVADKDLKSSYHTSETMLFAILCIDTYVCFYIACIYIYIHIYIHIYVHIMVT